MSERTRREELQYILELSMDGMTPEDLRVHLANQHGATLSQKDVLGELDHIRQSLRHDDAELLAQPPECKKCGFNEFDRVLGVPSKCPECRSEWVAQPKFTID